MEWIAILSLYVQIVSWFFVHSVLFDITFSELYYDRFYFRFIFVVYVSNEISQYPVFPIIIYTHIRILYTCRQQIRIYASSRARLWYIYLPNITVFTSRNLVKRIFKMTESCRDLLNVTPNNIDEIFCELSGTTLFCYVFFLQYMLWRGGRLEWNLRISTIVKICIHNFKLYNFFTNLRLKNITCE